MDETYSPLADVAELFASAGVPARLAPVTVDRLGAAAAKELRADPWRLLEVTGVRPDQADFFARAVLGAEAAPGDPRRGAAIAVHLLLRAAGDGHTVTPASAVLAAMEPFGVGEPVEAVRAAIGDGRIAATESELLGPARLVSAEETLAEGLARLTAMAEPLPEAGGLPARHGVSVLTGPPQAVEEAVRAAAGAPGVLVTAVTDRAATALGGAASLHRLLEPGSHGYARGVDLPLEADLVVVAEADALDVEHAAALVEACMDGTHLLLCGDPAAPFPLGAGRVLADLTGPTDPTGAAGLADVTPTGTTRATGETAGAPVLPVTELRREPAGAIERIAAAARDGCLAAVEQADREVVIVPAAAAREAAHRTVQLVTDSIPRALGIPSDDVLVVTPAHRGEAGVTALNRALKAALNPGPGPYDTGDRVVCVRDLPCAAAGEIGTVTGTGEDGFAVEFPSGTATVPEHALRHGWSVSVRRAQGTRWPAVVAVLPAEAGGALTRPLVVGALTRARRHLSVVHAAGAELAHAVRERAEPPRRTRLANLLREHLAGM